MRASACLIGVLLAAGVAFAQVGPRAPGAPGLPQAPPRDTAPKTGTSRIRGKVVAADTGQPLRKAQVRATSAELRENRLATTDASGVYEFTELPAGRYQLNASKGSFVALQYGQLRPFEAGKPLEVGEAQTIEKVDFSLPRGGLITGRVLDEVGEPATDVQVSATRFQFVQGRRQLVPAGRPAMTNDIGEYRLFGLPPGQFYLSATLRAAGALDVISSDRSGYAPTYYPGTANVGEAERLTIETGQTRAGVDLVLALTRLARITGSAVDSDGKPLTGGFVLLVQRSGGGFSASSEGQMRPDGSFSISNVAPGEYTVGALVTGGGIVAGSSGDLISANVTVTGEDISGLRLAGVKASNVTGRVVLPPGAGDTIRPTTIQLSTPTVIPDPLSGVGLGRINDDLTFELKMPPGQRLVRLFTPVPGVTLKAVRLNGADVTDAGIDVRANEDISGLEVELTTEQSELSGTVTDARNRAVKDYSVVVFARDAERWTNGSRFFGGGRPDQDGRFKVRNLPAGDYYAIALDYVEPGAGTDPEFLEKVRDRATAFSLNDGQFRAVDLKLVVGP